MNCVECGQDHGPGMNHVEVQRLECSVCGRTVKRFKGLKKVDQILVAHHKNGGETCPGSIMPGRLVDTVVWPVKPIGSVISTIKKVWEEYTNG